MATLVPDEIQIKGDPTKKAVSASRVGVNKSAFDNLLAGFTGTQLQELLDFIDEIVLSGSGDVTGPAGATAGNFPVLDATGKVLSDSGVGPSDFEAAGAVSTHETTYDHSQLHTHANNATLDKITEDGGQPLWDGGVWPGGTEPLFWSFFSPSEKTKIVGFLTSKTSISETDHTPMVQEYLDYCNANNIQNPVIPCGLYAQKTCFDFSGFSNMVIAADGSEFFTHAGFVPSSNLNTINPGVFNRTAPGGDAPPTTLYSTHCDGVRIVGAVFDANAQNTNPLLYNWQIYTEDACTGLVLDRCHFRNVKSLIQIAGKFSGLMNGCTYQEAAFGSQICDFIHYKFQIVGTGLNDLLVKATASKGWYFEDQRRYRIKISSPSGGIDTYVWCESRGGYLNISASDATKVSHTAVNNGSYVITENATGVAPGNDVVPSGKYGAVAFDLGTDGVLDVVEAADNASGYTSSDSAKNAVAGVAANHMRLGYCVVMKSDGAFTFGTTALNAANVVVAFPLPVNSDNQIYDQYSLFGPWTTTARQINNTNSAWYAQSQTGMSFKKDFEEAPDPLLDDYGNRAVAPHHWGNGGAIDLADPVNLLGVTFSATTGHTVGDTWEIVWGETRRAAMVIGSSGTSNGYRNFLANRCLIGGNGGEEDIGPLFVNSQDDFVITDSDVETISASDGDSFLMVGGKIGYSEFSDISGALRLLGVTARYPSNIPDPGINIQLTGTFETVEIDLLRAKDFGKMALDDTSLAHSSIKVAYATIDDLTITNNSFRQIDQTRDYYAISFFNSTINRSFTVDGNKVKGDCLSLMNNAAYAEWLRLQGRSYFLSPVSGTFSVNVIPGSLLSLTSTTQISEDCIPVRGMSATLSGFTDPADDGDYPIIHTLRDSRGTYGFILSGTLDGGVDSTCTGISIVSQHREGIDALLTPSSSSPASSDELVGRSDYVYINAVSTPGYITYGGINYVVKDCDVDLPNGLAVRDDLFINNGSGDITGCNLRISYFYNLNAGATISGAGFYSGGNSSGPVSRWDHFRVTNIGGAGSKTEQYGFFCPHLTGTVVYSYFSSSTLVPFYHTGTGHFGADLGVGGDLAVNGVVDAASFTKDGSADITSGLALSAFSLEASNHLRVGGFAGPYFTLTAFSAPLNYKWQDFGGSGYFQITPYNATVFGYSTVTLGTFAGSYTFTATNLATLYAFAAAQSGIQQNLTTTATPTFAKLDVDTIQIDGNYIISTGATGVAGTELYIMGQYASGGTDLNGGNLHLYPGGTTGTGSSAIYKHRILGSITSGSTQNTSGEVAGILPSVKKLLNNTTTEIFRTDWSAANNVVGGTIKYVLSATNGTDVHVAVGFVEYAVGLNSSGTRSTPAVVASTPRESKTGSSVLTTLTWDMITTANNHGHVRLLANFTGFTPTDISLRYETHHGGQGNVWIGG